MYVYVFTYLSLPIYVLTSTNSHLSMYMNISKARMKRVNASQLEIRNFNDITGKHMRTPFVFYF